MTWIWAASMEDGTSPSAMSPSPVTGDHYMLGIAL